MLVLEYSLLETLLLISSSIPWKATVSIIQNTGEGGLESLSNLRLLLSKTSQFSQFVLIFLGKGFGGCKSLEPYWETAFEFMCCAALHNRSTHGPLCVMAHQRVLSYPGNFEFIWHLNSYLFVYKVIQCELRL